MGIISIFNKKKAIKEKDLPWYNLPSILGFIKSRLDANGKLTEEGYNLPDEERRYKDKDIKWVAGGMDGAFGHHGGDGSSEDNVKKVAGLVTAISENNSQTDKVELYKLLLNDELLDFIDPALEVLVDSDISVDPYLHKYARWLAFESPDRGPVKFGIALLGLIRNEDDMDKICLLGRHEEFTLYASVALRNTNEDPELVLWDMAKYVDGWGKIQIVERLGETQNPDIKKWLIREGYKNNIMYEYLAYTCAVGGDLKTELSKAIVDQKLLSASGDIIEALLYGGPAEDIDDYDDGAEVVKLFVDHMAHQPDLKLSDFLVLDSLKRFLTDEDSDWDERKQRGWTDTLRSELIIVINQFIKDPKWARLVQEKKNTKDSHEFWQVDKAASAIGIDLWETHWQRLTENPTDPSHWYNIMRNVNHERIDQVLELAIKKIPLDAIATGVKDEMGLGQEYELHSCLDYILQDLNKFPGKGLDLIETGLKSPVTRNRNMAIKALSAWRVEHWPEGIKQILTHAEKEEPNDDTKESIKSLLDGISIE